MRVDRNGYNSDNDSFVGVYLVIMKGDFDHQLHWSFSYAYTLTVIDQQLNGKDQARVQMGVQGVATPSFPIGVVQ